MNISLSTPQNNCAGNVPFPGTMGHTTRRSIPVTASPSFMEERVLDKGFSLYLTELLPSTPVVMSSDTWPTGFGWVFIISGRIFYHHDSFGREIRMEAGMNRLAFQPGASGSARLYPGDPIRIVTITLSQERFVQTMASDIAHLPEGFRRACRKPDSPGIFALNHNTWDIQAALSRLVAILSCPGASELLVKGLALELMGLQTMQFSKEVCRTISSKEQEKIIQAQSLLTGAMENPPKLTELARRVGLTPNRLSQGFKAVYGATPFVCLKRARLERAQELLATRQMNVTETAMAVGYDSLSHFSKAFYNHFKRKPCEVKSRILP